MADDGMLLNFELPSDAFAPKQTFKGGTWKDRLTAKKSANWGRKKAQERIGAPKSLIPSFEEVASDDEERILPGSGANKRAKTNDHGAFRPASRPSVNESRTTHEGPSKIGTKGSSSEVISSLFTYNPKSTVPEAQPIVNNDTAVEPSNAPLQDELATFTNLGLTSILARHLLTKLEIKSPTAIQRKAIEQLCRTDSDAFIQAETGSGKTLAYLLPILQKISKLSKQMKDAGEGFNRESGLFALILAPTRELSKQINAVLESLLACCHWIVGGTVIGGEKKKSEKARLRKGLNVLVATPGRLVDHLDHTEVLDVSKVRWLVLDEGDRLMELGFEQDIQRIVSTLNLRSRKATDKIIPGLPERRTTVLCSATIKADVEKLRSIALKDPSSISVDPAERAEDGAASALNNSFSAPAQLKQSYAIVPPKQRLVTLVATLKQTFRRKGSVTKCIVFMSCADSVDFHFEVLTTDLVTSESRFADNARDEDSGDHSERLANPNRTVKIPQGNTITESRTQGLATTVSSKENPVQVFRLHGSLQQATRTSTLKAFTTCKEPAILVCTDVASRGLDLPNVDLVIEYDPPFSKEDHLHRVGRTARAGKDGRALIFLMPGCEEGYVEFLKEGRPRNITRHVSNELLRKGFSADSGVVSEKDWEDRATDWQLEIERWALQHPKHLEQARRAFQSQIRAYATHVAAERGIFDMQQLHLGHLAKAFALRDKPSNVRIPGHRPGDDARRKVKESRRAQAGRHADSGAKRSRKDGDFDVPAVTDEQDARKKMQAKIKSFSGSSEFNLG